MLGVRGLWDGLRKHGEGMTGAPGVHSENVLRELATEAMNHHDIKELVGMTPNPTRYMGLQFGNLTSEEVALDKEGVALRFTMDVKNPRHF